MNKEVIQPEDPDDEPEDSLSSEEIAGTESRKRRHRRIKTRKRVRIKKRTTSKRKARKTMETVAWVLIVAAFVVTLIIMVLQLDLTDKRTKRFQNKTVSGIIINVSSFNI